MNRAVYLVVASVLGLAACGPTTVGTPRPSPSSSPSASLHVLQQGPGPQNPYTVQQQPKPGTCHYRYEGAYPLPDPKCTPGATNPQVTQANIQQTICTRGWTATIRPPQSVTGAEKRANALSYGYTGSTRTSEYDHLVPLELGGDPNDPRNLWVEPNDNPNATSFGNAKDPVENAARAAVCSGTMPLAEAQYEIATDWVAFGKNLKVLP